MTNTKEAKARIKINHLLEESGWRFFDDANGSTNIHLELNTKITKQDIDAFGEDFESTKNGFIDFLLLDDRGFPLVVLEAKKEEKNPLDAKEQARRYAQSLNVRFIILSNGNLHYFWDLERGNPEVITEYPTQESLLHRHEFKPNNQRLADAVVEKDYIALSQNPRFTEDPRYLDPETRDAYIYDEGLQILRPYQQKAIYALQKSAEGGNVHIPMKTTSDSGKNRPPQTKTKRSEELYIKWTI